MHYYLAPYVGVGSHADPFRPRGSEQPGWSAIDLRPNGAVITGRALMAVPTRDDTIGVYLGDAPDSPSLAVKAAIEISLGVILTADRLRTIIPEVLIQHARTDGTRWRPLRPSTQRKQYEIFLGELFWSQPVVAGGVDVTETFNTADSDILGPVASWTELEGDWDVVSNQASAISGQPCLARADTDMATDDHLTEFTVITVTRSSAALGMGPICRKDSTATLTYYLWWGATDAGGSNHYLYKVIAGTATQLGATATNDLVANELMRVRADGSTIDGSIDGVVITSVADTEIVDKLRGGIRGYVGAGDVVILDNGRVADLTAAAPVVRPIPTPARSILGVGT